MEQFLNDYIKRLRTELDDIPDTTAHEIASAFLAFRFGLYANAARECSHAIGLLGAGANPAHSGAYAALKKALAIVLANAEDLDNSKVTADMARQFDEQERRYIAITLAPDTVEDPGTLELDNALVLVYVAALIASPEDEGAMGEHRKYIVRLLAGYKKALGIK
ncbi:MAG: hypothetical protein CVV30_02850 [Methanomicrobiales archaeon HGW-Methanomicrobiales-1]|jgi:hypothetical protein|nr:MAG: hypothetical protein CVV30_02850 [Methanomicrobiales archaeon HGW-Methanomicrobiales-1]